MREMVLISARQILCHTVTNLNSTEGFGDEQTVHRTYFETRRGVQFDPCLYFVMWQKPSSLLSEPHQTRVDFADSMPPIIIFCSSVL